MIDTHAHLYHLDTPLETVISHAKAHGLVHIVNIGIDIKTSLKALEQAALWPSMVSATVGVHPCDCSEKVNLNQVMELATSHPFVAIGEIGLDYHHMTTSKKDQYHGFVKQLEIAQTLGLPVVIHNRKADEDIKAIIREFPDVKKVLHCYSSSASFAESILNANTYFSFTGMITFAKKGKTVQAIRAIPLEHIMIETDAPYLKPKYCESPENEPANVRFVAEKIAEIKQLDKAHVVDQLTQTSIDFFNLTK